MISIEKAKECYEHGVWASRDAMKVGERCRDYYMHQQYTTEEISERETDGKALVKINKVRPKINRLVGEVISQKTDPRAFPRTPKHEKHADVATDGLKYACDKSEFDSISTEEAEKMFVEGIFGVIVEVDPKTFDIKLTNVPYDRYFYDPHSRRKDFSDAQYNGIVRWQEIEDAKLEYPGKEESFVYDQTVLSGESFEDKPDHKKYWDYARKRVLTIQMFYMYKKEWWFCIFTEKGFLEEPTRVGYVGEDNEPVNPMVMGSAYVDRQGQRSSHLYILLDLQDEINHQRNKALDYVNKNQTWSRGTSLTEAEVQTMNTEKEKVNGHIVFPVHGKLDEDFGFIPNANLSQVHFNFYLEASRAIDDVGASAAFEGKQENQSGRALAISSQNALKEMLIDYELHRKWKLRVYRAMWQRIKQFWKEEKWIRITDDEKKVRYVGLNVPITKLEKMLSEREGVAPLEIRDRYEAELEQAYQQDPMLREPGGVANDVSELDVDIVLDEVPDTVNLQSEQFDILSKMAERYPDKVPFEAMLELSTIRNKDKVKKMLGGDESPEAKAMMMQQQQAQQEAQELEKANAIADIKETNSKALNQEADAKLVLAQAEAQELENDLVESGMIDLLR